MLFSAFHKCSGVLWSYDLSPSFCRYPVILSIENHCSISHQKKMAQYLVEILGEKLDLSSVPADESGRLPSPEALKGKILVKVTTTLLLFNLHWKTLLFCGVGLLYGYNYSTGFLADSCVHGSLQIFTSSLLHRLVMR